MTPDYPLALATGLLGGFGHCLGMCGPVVGAFALRPGDGPRLLPHLLYHAGRLTTYAFLGALLGLGGSFVNAAGRLAGLQNLVALVAGALMIVMGLGILGVAPLPRQASGDASRWLRLAGPILETRSAAGFYPLGLLLGFLPCGLFATVLLMAAATADPLQGYLLALLFGLGTTPALLIFGMVVGTLGARLRGALYRAGGAAVVAMGILALGRGLAACARM